MVNVWPLAIIQARYHSKRLPGKMCLRIGKETLIERVHRLTVEAFYPANVVVAIPKSDETGPLGDELRRINAQVFAWDGDEGDVLGRFHACAHHYLWHPDSIVVRVTADDWRKDPTMMRRVAGGQRLPVEQGGEAFTLAMLDEVQQKERKLEGMGAGCSLIRDSITGDAIGACRCGRELFWEWDYDASVGRHFNSKREHITHCLFPSSAPQPPDDGLPWSIDTVEDLERAVASL